MAMPEMDAVKDAALKYDKPTLGRLAQMGQISPTIAVMAGMMRDRIVQSEMKPPSPPTVAQEVMQPMGQRMGLAAAAQPQAPQRPQGQGLDQVPVPENMFDERRMAGGGIVAFQAGGQSRMAGALEGVLARLKERDPNLNLDYVRSAILKAPREQQETLLNQLMASVGEAPARAMPASFTEALNEADASQADTGAQFGARDIPGSQILAQKADAAGNIYARPGGPAYGLAAIGQANAAPAPAPSPDIDYSKADMGSVLSAASDTGGVPTQSLAEFEKLQADKQAQQDAIEAAKEKPINMGSITDRAGKMARGIVGESTVDVPTIEEASKETSDLLKASGFDSNLFKTLQSDIAKQREELKGDRKEAMNLRLIEAGLGIMGGESPNAFVNIGKGAAPAIKGLGEDIKGLKKAERELVNAERDLRMKENDFALGKAKISQASIDKARDRADKEREQYTRLQGEFAKTMLSGEIQKQVAKETYGSRMTDFDKKWAIASEEAKRKGVPMSTEFFASVWGGGIGQEAAARIAAGMAPVKELDLTKPEDVEIYNTIVNQIKSGGLGARSTAPTPAMNQSALEWANANPNDPRAKEIKSYLGAK